MAHFMQRIRLNHVFLALGMLISLGSNSLPVTKYRHTIWPYKCVEKLDMIYRNNDELEITHSGQMKSQSVLQTFESSQTSPMRELEVFITQRIDLFRVVIVSDIISPDTALERILSQYPPMSLYTRAVRIELRLQRSDEDSENALSALEARIVSSNQDFVMLEPLKRILSRVQSFGRYPCAKDSDPSKFLCYASLVPLLTVEHFLKAMRDAVDTMQRWNPTMEAAMRSFSNKNLRENLFALLELRPMEAHTKILYAWRTARITDFFVSSKLVEDGLIRVIHSCDPVSYWDTTAKHTLMLKAGRPQLPLHTAVDADMHVHLQGAGAHRQYQINIDTHQTIRASKCRGSWTLNLMFPVSNEIYVDLDELKHLQRSHSFTFRAFTDHIDIERPASVSAFYWIAMHHPITMDSANELRFSFPIHLRYQKPSHHAQYRDINILPPNFYISCTEIDSQPWTNGISDHNNEYILQDTDRSLVRDTIHLQSGYQLQPRALQVAVPVGNYKLSLIVAVLTFSASWIGAASIIFATSQLSR